MLVKESIHSLFISGKPRKDDEGNPPSSPNDSPGHSNVLAPPNRPQPPTTALLITVVPAVIGTVAHSPFGDAAVVRFTAEFRMVVTAIGRAHWEEKVTKSDLKSQSCQELVPQDTHHCHIQEMLLTSNNYHVTN